MAPKFKAYVKEMYTEHQELFDKFDRLHAEYVLDRVKWQDKFNEEGRAVMRVVEEWENKLCTRMEKGKYSNFSHKLGEKFREELRVRYPKIDFIGVTIKKSRPAKKSSSFDLPQIKFS